MSDLLLEGLLQVYTGLAVVGIGVALLPLLERHHPALRLNLAPNALRRCRCREG